MLLADNIAIINDIERLLSEKVRFRLGINKKNELVRLIYEISVRDSTPPESILDQACTGLPEDSGSGEIFHLLKRRLMMLRYPSFTQEQNPHLKPLKLEEGLSDADIWDLTISPEKIFIEKQVMGLDWTKRFLSFFKDAEVKEIGSFKEGVGSFPPVGPVRKYNKRRENIFLIHNKDAFIKACPCTKGYKRCGYWILNIGLGCPIDCSYCFLQLYSNSPGLVLPANVEDYFPFIDEFDSKVKGRTRIGTGEYTDSLALDKYTGYSSLLVPAFRKTTNLVLELKTKISDIDEVLRQEPHENVVLSWSVNTPEMAELYEKGGAPIQERIDAASRAAKRGFKVGFHFDPVVYSPGWEERYKVVVEDIFSRDELMRNTLWLSLGTLRYTPGLKQVTEQRFSDNRMYYWGEFFEDTDGKLRYPREVRTDIYSKMAGWIKKFDTRCWVYLCMEPEEVWRKVFG